MQPGKDVVYMRADSRMNGSYRLPVIEFQLVHIALCRGKSVPIDRHLPDEPLRPSCDLLEDPLPGMNRNMMIGHHTVGLVEP